MKTYPKRNRSIKKSNKNIQDDFIQMLSYVDKASTKYAIMSKKVYCKILKESSEKNPNNYEWIKSKQNKLENRIIIMYKK